ncbi:MAG: hypothetical protein RQ899_14825 [Pseudomonadales bacterium]|nr:hypothetical protein [Pseudomonadales bacterium]
MDNTDNKDSGTLLTTDRRTFLGAVGVLASNVPLPTLGSAKQDTDHWQQPRRCVFQQMPYVSFDGVGESYDVPTGNQSTREYLDSISREEYLRRHWFI